MRCEHADKDRRAPYVTGVQRYNPQDDYTSGRDAVHMDGAELAKERGAVYTCKNAE